MITMAPGNRLLKTGGANRARCPNRNAAIRLGARAAYHQTPQRRYSPAWHGRCDPARPRAIQKGAGVTAKQTIKKAKLRT